VRVMSMMMVVTMTMLIKRIYAKRIEKERVQKLVVRIYFGCWVDPVSSNSELEIQKL